MFAKSVIELNLTKELVRQPRVLELEQLDLGSLLQLYHNHVVAIRVPNFYTEHQCDNISDRMLSSELYGNYANAPLIGRVGQSLFEATSCEKLRSQYEQNAINWIQAMRSYCSPSMSPIDMLRLNLDEIWSGGSSLGKIGGRKMFAGLARVFRSGAGAEPHQDILHWDLPDEAESHRIVAQFAANIYLSLPDFGGELIIWPESLDKFTYEKYKNPGSYGVSTGALKSEPVRIVPRKGELILFNSQLVHSVGESFGSPRVTWSCFVGAKSTTEPLMIWS